MSRKPGDACFQRNKNSWLFECGFFGLSDGPIGRYYKHGLLNLTKMDDHIAKMLSDGWEILTQTSHTGDRLILRPFAKRDTITVV